MSTAVDRRSLVRAAFRAGAVLAGVKVALFVVARLAFGMPGLIHIATGVVLWFATLIVLILAALHLKRETGTFQPYTRAFFHLAMTWAIGQLLFTGFSILLFNVIEPSLLETTVEPMREIARMVNQRMNIPPADGEAIVQSITKETSPFSVMGQLRGYRDGLLPGIVLSAVIAILFRARPAETPADAPAA